MHSGAMISNGAMRHVAMLFVTVILVSSALAATDGFGGKKRQQDPYQQRLVQQVHMIAPTAEQMEAFQQLLREYFDMRNGATRRIGRQGGDIDIRVSRELRRCARESVAAMSKVLSTEQLAHYEKLVEIGNEQYLANAGLL